MNREAIFKYIDEHQDEHVANVQRWVRQPSVSWDNIGVRECAELGIKDVWMHSGPALAAFPMRPPSTAGRRASG